MLVKPICSQDVSSAGPLDEPIDYRSVLGELQPVFARQSIPASRRAIELDLREEYDKDGERYAARFRVSFDFVRRIELEFTCRVQPTKRNCTWST